MCGIAGFFGAFPAVGLVEANRLQAHRGPDDSGTYFDAETGVGLAHVRLAIQDLSPLGHQPMATDDGHLVLVFNGEIYNFRNLRMELEASGVVFRGHSDTEVLLHLYEAEGEAMLSRLNGIFAFALYDRRKGELLLVRDGLGVKPLYFSDDKAGLAFASEIKALLAFKADPGPIDLNALQRYLTFLWCPEGTPLQNVHKLRPGEALRVRAGHIVDRWMWYRLSQTRAYKSSFNAQQAIAAVESGLRLAVQRQLVSDVPVGAFLSGGLDSSSVVAFAREQVPDIRCFSIELKDGADVGDVDDLPYARKVASHLNVPLDVVSVDAELMAGQIERMIWQLDEPLADPAPLNVLFISELARSAGIKVLLSGAGGDDLFTGYRRHVAVRYQALWSWLPQSARRGLDQWSAGLDQRRAIGRRLSRLLLGAGGSGDERLAAYFSWARRDDLTPLYSGNMRAALAGVLAEQPLLDFLAEVDPGCSDLERLLALEQRFFLADHNLLYTDKMSMAVGVEVRVPFLDQDLVELAARIPDRFKQRGPVGKWVLKKAMEPYLPHEVIYRPKTGFGAPLRRWLRVELRDWVADVLSEENIRRRGLFEPAAVQRLIADNDAGRRDGTYTLFSLLCIEVWCRRFVDQQILECHR